MPGKNVSINKIGDQIDVTLSELENANIQPLLEKVGEYLRDSIEERFETSTGPDGEAWPPLVARAGKPLIDKGDMMKNVISPEGTQIGSGFVSHTVVNPIAIIHQKGVDHPIKPNSKQALWWPGASHPVGETKGIPARPFMGLNDHDAGEILNITQEWYDGYVENLNK